MPKIYVLGVLVGHILVLAIMDTEVWSRGAKIIPQEDLIEPKPNKRRHSIDFRFVNVIDTMTWL